MAYTVNGHIVHDGDLAFTDDSSMGIVIADTIRCPDKTTSVVNANYIVSPDELTNDLDRQVYVALRAMVVRRYTPLPMTRRQPQNGDLVVTTQLEVGVLLGDAVYCANHVVYDTVLGAVDVHRGKTIMTYYKTLLMVAQNRLVATSNDLVAHACPLSTKLTQGHVYITAEHNNKAVVYLGTGTVTNVDTGTVKHGYAALHTMLGNILNLQQLLRHGRTPGSATKRELRNLAVADHCLTTKHMVINTLADDTYIAVYPRPFSVAVDICQVPGWINDKLRVMINNKVKAVFTPSSVHLQQNVV